MDCFHSLEAFENLWHSKISFLFSLIAITKRDNLSQNSLSFTIVHLLGIRSSCYSYCRTWCSTNSHAPAASSPKKFLKIHNSSINCKGCDPHKMHSFGLNSLMLSLLVARFLFLFIDTSFTKKIWMKMTSPRNVCVKRVKKMTNELSRTLITRGSP